MPDTSAQPPSILGRNGVGHLSEGPVKIAMTRLPTGRKRQHRRSDTSATAAQRVLLLPQTDTSRRSTSTHALTALPNLSRPFTYIVNFWYRIGGSWGQISEIEKNTHFVGHPQYE